MTVQAIAPSFLLFLAGLSWSTSMAQTVTDIDGNVYTTVTIGSQVWLQQNLATTRFNNGDSIPNITDPAMWTTRGTPSYCWFNNNHGMYGPVYGALYNWFCVDSASNGNRGLCPAGWHVPSDAEWTTLITFLGGESVAGGRMKEAGTDHWFAPNTGASNESGFTGLPGGYRGYVNGSFNYVGQFGHWWSSTRDNTSLAWGCGLFYLDAAIDRSTSVERNGFCVRCVKDALAGIDDVDALEGSCVLYQSYPNPCNPGTTISFRIASTSMVFLGVYDILGREVSVLVSGVLAPGTYSRHWNGSFAGGVLPAGCYLIRLQAGSFSRTQKLILLR